MKKVVFLMVFMLLAGSVSAVPGFIVHQWYIEDSDGKPVSCNQSIMIGIYSSPDGDDKLFEQAFDVEVKDGYYVIEVDDSALMPVFETDKNLYLEISIGAYKGTPRQKIGSVPYAFYSKYAYDAIGEIHPKSVWINGNKVIDENGKWVGDSSSIPGVKSITAASPLTGGTITDTGTIGISKADASTDGYLSKDDFALFFSKQNRISGVCQAGYCINKVNEDGTVECELCGGGSSSVSISAGDGIVVDPNPIAGVGKISIDKVYFDNLYVLKGAISVITGDMIVDNSITGADIADNSIPLMKLSGVGCTDGQVVKYYVDQPGIAYFKCDEDKTGITSCNACDSTFVNEGQVDSIKGVMIVDRSVNISKLSDSGCSGGETIKYNDIIGQWVCAKDDNTTYSAGTGLSLINNKFSIKNNVFQCSNANESIKAIDIDMGTVVCETDDNSGGTVTRIDTGFGLTGGPITDNGTISLAGDYLSGAAYDNRFINVSEPNSINSDMIVDNTVTNDDLSVGSYPNITGVGTLDNLKVSGDTHLAISSGGVGIGGVDPGTRKLMVGGDVEITGNLYAGVWQKILETQISSADDYVIKGLDGDKDKEYIIILKGYIVANGADRIIGVRPNGDTSNYTRGTQHVFEREGSSYNNFVSWWGNTYNILPLGRNGWSSNGDIIMKGYINADTGAIRCIRSEWTFVRSGYLDYTIGGSAQNCWMDRMTNIDYLTLYFDGATAFKGKLMIFALRDR